MSRRENPFRIEKLPGQASGGELLSGPAGGRLSLRGLAALLAAGLLAFSLAVPLCAQEPKSKLPVVGRLTPGNQQHLYSGMIQSLDLKQKILSVTALHGTDSEIFPVKKNLRVESVNGNRLDLKALVPGASVLIYYDQKSGERTVKHVVVLSSGKSQEKGEPAPPS